MNKVLLMRYRQRLPVFRVFEVRCRHERPYYRSFLLLPTADRSKFQEGRLLRLAPAENCLAFTTNVIELSFPSRTSSKPQMIFKLIPWSVPVLVVFTTNVLAAQDMRIYTQIRMKVENGSVSSSQKAAEQQPLVRGVMIFHAGKVYDYIEPAQEITVFEPALKRFTVLNKPRQLRSELRQEEILHFLDLAKSEAEKHLTQGEVDASRKSLELLQFQLQPAFSVAFDAAKSQLQLESPAFRYAVHGVTPAVPGVAENYLHVADWIAQLNSILHPNSFLPGPRMALNQELRQRGLVPSTVELTIESDSTIRLIAQHQWTWNLKETDRQLISDWERLLQDSNFRTLSFRQYQQEVLKTEMARRR
jgi:hypothetical protein